MYIHIYVYMYIHIYVYRHIYVFFKRSLETPHRATSWGVDQAQDRRAPISKTPCTQRLKKYMLYSKHPLFSLLRGFSGAP